MNKHIFKVGDRVKCMECRPGYMELEGELGTIKNIEEGYADVAFDNWRNPTEYDGTYIVNTSQLELIQREDDELINLITKIEGMLRKQNKYWSIARIPSAKAYSIYISEEESEDDE